MPRKMLGKEERDTSPVECYGFTKSISSRESANPNLKTSGGSCRITTYFVPMLINHKIKKKPIFLLPTLNMLASATRFGFLGFSAAVWNPLVPYDFFAFFPGGRNGNEDISGFIFFYNLYIDVDFCQPEIFLILPSHSWLSFTLYQVFNFRKGTMGSVQYSGINLCAINRAK